MRWRMLCVWWVVSPEEEHAERVRIERVLDLLICFCLIYTDQPPPPNLPNVAADWRTSERK